MHSDGEVLVPMIWPKVLADMLAAFAQAGFTFKVESHQQMDVWVVKLSR